jgi:tetratricopeptide (TPR) repeat protein
VATNLAALARIERARDHLDAALRLDTRALAIYETKLGKDNVQLAEMLTGQGETHLAAQRPADAIAPLTRALALTEPRADYRSATNHLRFLLARALWDARSDRARALTLAETAAAESSADAKARAEITAWLTARRR